MARIVAKALNCTNLQDGEPCDRCAACVAIREGTSLDVAEMDAASNNKVDDMRELLPRIATAPSDLRRKVFIVDEVQRIKEGWDVLLKTLEEPPDHVAFIFCTTDAGGIRPAVLSRVQRFDFRRLTVDQIAGKLRRILAEIGREADDDAIDLIARRSPPAACGTPSRCSTSSCPAATEPADRRAGPRPARAGRRRGGRRLPRARSSAATPLAGMAILDELEERGRDLRAFLDQVIEALRSALVAGLADGAEPRTRRLTARRGRPPPGGHRSGPARSGRPALPARARAPRGSGASLGGPGGSVPTRHGSDPIAYVERRPRPRPHRRTEPSGTAPPRRLRRARLDTGARRRAPSRTRADAPPAGRVGRPPGTAARRPPAPRRPQPAAPVATGGRAGRADRRRPPSRPRPRRRPSTADGLRRAGTVGRHGLPLLERAWPVVVRRPEPACRRSSR